MRTGAGGSWLAVGLLLGCGLDPSEVVGVYDGQGSSSSGASGDGPSTASGGSASTGPVADGSAGSDTGMPQTSDVGDTTTAVDPSTTDPGTTTLEPPESTGPASTSEGSSSGDPPAPPTCMELFGAATSYMLCWEDAASCGFNVNPGGLTCTAVCGLFGAACIDNFDNPGPGEECVVQATEADCNSNLGEGSTICVCARP